MPDDIDAEGELPRDECREMIQDCLVAQKNHLPLLIQGLAKEIIGVKQKHAIKKAGEERAELAGWARGLWACVGKGLELARASLAAC